MYDVWEWISSWWTGDATADPLGGFDADALASADYTGVGTLELGDGVDWNAVAQGWEEGHAAATPAPADPLGWLQPVGKAAADVGALVLNKALSRSGASSPAAPAVQAPQARAAATQGNGGIPALASSGAAALGIPPSVLTLALLAGGAALAFKVLKK